MTRGEKVMLCVVGALETLNVLGLVYGSEGDLVPWLLFLILVGLPCGVLTAWRGARCGRSPWLWFLWGFGVGIVGVVVSLLWSWDLRRRAVTLQ